VGGIRPPRVHKVSQQLARIVVPIIDYYVRYMHGSLPK